MQCVVRVGEDYVFAEHEDGQNVADLYPEQHVTGPEGGAPVTIPAGEIVAVPRDFVFAYDELDRRLDPRRFAGEGSTPLG